jgi:hypothetical protein
MIGAGAASRPDQAQIQYILSKLKQLCLDKLVRPFYSPNKRTEERTMGTLVIAITVLVCSAYLLWQFWEADLIDDR